MFIGHYGASLALKAVAPRVNLGVYFVAVQALDVLFCTLVLVGVERIRIVPGFTEYNPYDLYFMPYSHSLVGAAAWAALAGLAWAVLRAGDGPASALAVGAAVFSHFVLDVPVHTPDLPVFGDGSTKLGLGLWNHRMLALGLELAVFGGGWALLARTRPAFGRARPMRILGAVMAVVLVLTPFLPPPKGAVDFAVQALGAYVLLALAAAWVERRAMR
jgi:hypothetical protein